MLTIESLRDKTCKHLQVKNETHALWTWYRNQDMYNRPGDQIYIVREPKRCPIDPEKVSFDNQGVTRLL